MTGQVRSAGLFDLRYILGLLFGVYGVVLTVMGLWFTDSDGIDKAGGVNVNLWSGLAMLVVAVLFAGWARLRPIRLPAAGQSVEAGETVEAGRD
ncbi:MAG: hypothetical protein JOZ47_02015 [Kutzneria sp.]|nr:hypothetical protein [Kutzneria sp.]